MFLVFYCGNPENYLGANLTWVGRELKSYSKSGTSVSYTYDSDGLRGTNPANLTPRPKDSGSGLSFSTIPRPGAAQTTIEELNSTGIVYAFQDKGTHVTVIPIGGTVDDWITEGPSSIWTQAVWLSVVKWDGN